MNEPTSTVPGAHRPGPGAWGQLVLAEMRMVIRDTSGLVVPLGLPLLILVMFGLSAADEPIPELGEGVTALDWYVVPLVLVIVVATIGVINMPSFLATYRKTGVLRRLGVTPVHPAMVLVARGGAPGPPGSAAIEALHLASLAVVTVGASALAALKFRWD